MRNDPWPRNDLFHVVLLLDGDVRGELLEAGGERLHAGAFLRGTVEHAVQVAF